MDKLLGVSLPAASEIFKVVEVATEAISKAEDASRTAATPNPRHVLGQGVVGIHHPRPVAASAEVAAVGRAAAERTGALLACVFTRRLSLALAAVAPDGDDHQDDPGRYTEDGQDVDDLLLQFDRHGTLQKSEDFTA